MKKQIDTTQPHFRLVRFYSRPHQPVFLTLREAMSAADVGQADYTEVWQMTNETDGEMVHLHEQNRAKIIRVQS